MSIKNHDRIKFSWIFIIRALKHLSLLLFHSIAPLALIIRLQMFFLLHVPLSLYIYSAEACLLFLSAHILTLPHFFETLDFPSSLNDPALRHGFAIIIPPRKVPPDVCRKRFRSSPLYVRMGKAHLSVYSRSRAAAASSSTDAS